MCQAFTPDMRNFDEKPYTPDEQRVVKYLVELTNGTIGGGDDPIGFLIASHATLSDLNVKRCREEAHG